MPLPFYNRGQTPGFCLSDVTEPSDEVFYSISDGSLKSEAKEFFGRIHKILIEVLSLMKTH